jgi:phage internal scaffolding protein
MNAKTKKYLSEPEQVQFPDLVCPPVRQVCVRSAYQRERFVTKLEGASKTMQSFKDECDINVIMSRYQKTGIIDHVSRYQGSYEDVTEFFDYRDSLDRVRAADLAFSTLPSSIRLRFDNSPAAFLDFVSDASNQDEMRKMGLIPAEPPAAAPAASGAAKPDVPAVG